ncbi:MAG: tRNA (adenosine(37)-N6)-threonylcarbamoyltransferase complex ATPase subunit type 1 TsaE [Clostridia bacterium]|nr:tRNA (adenosine(37)-N6)-threonylcarbamoyltransferase complex ATPase subunit type 1 TsaE [Clostridia bacterium]
MQSFHCGNLAQEDMRLLAARLASRLRGGDFIALNGDLGAGKTTFIQGLCAYWGIEDICSPTFTIVNEYDAAIPFFHFDAYRLADEEELYAMGFTDYLGRNGVIAMEWSDIVRGALPPDHLEIRVAGSGEETRSIDFIAHGERFSTLLEELALC